MNSFNYKKQILYAENVSIPDIISRWGTPCYIYSRKTLEQHWHMFDQALRHHSHFICYAVKANSNIAILDVLARLGSGFDVVSGGELARVIAAGGDPGKTVFSGVGKTTAEIEYALTHHILCFNVESIPELEHINKVAQQLNLIAPVTLRINPDIDVKTHPYIATGLKENKFGIAYDQALSAYQVATKLTHIHVVGLACHIGSQILDLAPYVAALERMLLLEQQLKASGFMMRYFDLGGGIGVRYRGEIPPHPQDLAITLKEKVTDKNLTIIIEPGRAIAANAGILVTQVEYVKLLEHKNFAIVDAAMNDLMRPALYNAWHDIIPVNSNVNAPRRQYDVVGSVCETGDFLGKERELSIKQGDLLAICSAGAYGFTMSSNYNTRPRAAEVLVDGDKAYLIRKRETVTELFAGEKKIET